MSTSIILEDCVLNNMIAANHIFIKVIVKTSSLASKTVEIAQNNDTQGAAQHLVTLQIVQVVNICLEIRNFSVTT